VTRDHTDDARDELARRQKSGTHNPVSECPTCGTLRTPGQTHTRGDDLPEAKTATLFNQCNG
jgi:hypothetical protein